MFLSANVKELRRMDDELFRAQRALARAQDAWNTFQTPCRFEALQDAKSLVEHLEREIASIQQVIDEEKRADRIIGTAELYFSKANSEFEEAERNIIRAFRDVADAQAMFAAFPTSANRQMVADDVASLADAKRRYRAARRELATSKTYLYEVRRGLHH